MDNNIIDFKAAVAEEIKKISPMDREALDLVARRKAAIKKLGGYRGEVQSKNTIRQLPDVRIGEIFWVSMDEKAYIVADKDKKKITLKALDENASISTGMTIFDMNKDIISKEPLFDWEDEEAISTLKEQLDNWFNTETEDQFYLLYGRDLHYITLLNATNRAKQEMVIQDRPFATLASATARIAKDIIVTDMAETLKETLMAIGDVISFEFNCKDEQKSIEIWIRTSKSPAELLYLFPYDNGIVNI